MDEIEVEAASLRSEIDTQARALSCTDRREQLNSAEALLASLRKRLDKPISHELKRRIVEALVGSIQGRALGRPAKPSYGDLPVRRAE